MMRIRLALSLVAAAAIAGTSSRPLAQGSGATLSGTVVDRDTMQPVEAEIGIIVRAAAGGALSLRHIAASGGVFAVERLPAGTVHLTTKLASYAPEHATIVLSDRETHALELRLARGRTLRGGVQDAAGSPVPEAVVSVAYATDSTRTGAIEATYQWETGDILTDENGMFVMRDIHPDREFIVQAEYRDFLPAISEPLRLNALSAEAGLRLVLERGMSVTGIVRDSSGRPVRDARIRIVSPDQEARWNRFPFSAAPRGRPGWVVSGADGRFRIERARPGPQRVEILRDGYQLWRTDLMVPQGSGELQVPGVMLLERR